MRLTPFARILQLMNSSLALAWPPIPIGHDFLRPRVKVALYPTRFVSHLPKSEAKLLLDIPKTPKDRQAFIKHLVDRGLRAQLQTGSFISGQLFVALQNFPNAPKATVDWSQDPPEFPTVPGGLAPFEEKILTILTKLEQMPLDDISRDVRNLLGTLERGRGRGDPRA